jgi:hypothetical protein
MDWRDRSGVAPLFLVLVGVLAALGLIGGGSYLYFKNDQKDVQVPPGACDCPDQFDIKSRIAEATAARNAFEKSAATRSYNDSVSGKPEMYSDAAKAAETTAAKPAVEAATTARTASGETGSDCTTKINAPSPCLRAAIQTHENVHSLTCQAMKKDGRVGFMRDYKFQMTMVTFLRNEVAGYDAEIAYLKNEMARIQADPKCKWVAVETYPGRKSKEDQKEALARAKQRVTTYVRGIS